MVTTLGTSPPLLLENDTNLPPNCREKNNNDIHWIFYNLHNAVHIPFISKLTPPTPPRPYPKAGSTSRSQPFRWVLEWCRLSCGGLGTSSQTTKDVIWCNSWSLEGIEGNIDEVEGNIDGIEGNIDEVEGNIDGIEGNIDGIEGNIDEIEGNIDEIEGNIDGTEGNIDGIEGQETDTCVGCM